MTAPRSCPRVRRAREFDRRTSRGRAETGAEASRDEASSVAIDAGPGVMAETGEAIETEAEAETEIETETDEERDKLCRSTASA